MAVAPSGVKIMSKKYQNNNILSIHIWYYGIPSVMKIGSVLKSSCIVQSCLAAIGKF